MQTLNPAQLAQLTDEQRANYEAHQAKRSKVQQFTDFIDSLKGDVEPLVELFDRLVSLERTVSPLLPSTIRTEADVTAAVVANVDAIAEAVAPKVAAINAPAASPDTPAKAAVL